MRHKLTRQVAALTYGEVTVTIMEAAREGDVSALQRLLAEGVDIEEGLERQNRIDLGGVDGGRIETVKVLL